MSSGLPREKSVVGGGGGVGWGAARLTFLLVWIEGSV